MRLFPGVDSRSRSTPRARITEVLLSNKLPYYCISIAMQSCYRFGASAKSAFVLDETPPDLTFCLIERKASCTTSSPTD